MILKYKDTLFRMIFKEPKRAIMLYNVVSGSHYPADTQIEVNALSEMLFTDKENDVSFVLDDKLIIFMEHQSTVNNNMPLRFLEYLTANYRYIKSKKKYVRGLYKMPKPEFYVLYNGREKWDKEYLKLSDAFIENSGSDTFVELVARVVSIKPDTGAVDIKADNELYVYSVFIARVQRGLDDGKSVFDALKQAREYCLQQGMSSYMLDRWEEVTDMMLEEFSLYEYSNLLAEERGEKRGEKRKALKIATNLLKSGADLEMIQNVTELSLDTLRSIRI